MKISIASYENEIKSWVLRVGMIKKKKKKTFEAAELIRKFVT